MKAQKSEKDLKAIRPIVEEINVEFSKLNNISDEELKSNFNKIVCGLSDLIKNNKESSN